KERLREKYPALKDKADLLNAVPVGQTQKLIDTIKEPTGATPEDLRKFVDENAQTVKEEDVRAFVEENYQAGGRKNVTGEEVQRIKDLIAQQGSLEFRIAANAHRDGAAFRAAEEFFKNKDNEARSKEELERAAKAGLPP